jgi:uncharacterized membrane protein YphA (DoxX/SURF4 family)
MLLSPLVLRFMLAITFAWAGWGKLAGEMLVSGEDAAILGNLGMIKPTTPPLPAPNTAPSQPLPVPGSPRGEASGTESLAGSALTPTGSLVPILSMSMGTTLAQSAPAAPAAAPRPYSADDFIIPVPVPRMYGIALRVVKASRAPMFSPGGSATAPSGAALSTGRAAWPGFLGTGVWPKAQAQAVMLTELICAALLVLGLFTRPAALALAGVMLGALWLDQIGPQFQVYNTSYVIIPNFSTFDVRAWAPIMWQFSLLASALALALAGGGGLSLDRALAARASAEAARAASTSRAPADRRGAGA